jgi:hypothetical protein
MIERPVRYTLFEGAVRELVYVALNCRGFIDEGSRERDVLVYKVRGEFACGISNGVHACA